MIKKESEKLIQSFVFNLQKKNSCHILTLFFKYIVLVQKNKLLHNNKNWDGRKKTLNQLESELMGGVIYKSHSCLWL